MSEENVSTVKQTVKVVPIRLSEETHAKVLELAEKNGISLTALCAQMINNTLEPVGAVVVSEPEPEPTPEPEPEPLYPVDEFGVRIPQTTSGVDNKGKCQRCNLLKVPLMVVRFGKTPKSRRYSWWCKSCVAYHFRETDGVEGRDFKLPKQTGR